MVEEATAGGAGAASEAQVAITETDVASLTELLDPASEAARAEAARYHTQMVSEAGARVAGIQSRIDKLKEHLAGAEASLATAVAEYEALTAEAN